MGHARMGSAAQPVGGGGALAARPAREAARRRHAHARSAARPPRSGFFTWPVHRTLLAQGILIAEQLANLRSLAGQRVEFIFCPLPIAESDGSPARVLARAVEA
jgi:kynurenine formamidase